MNEYGEQKSLQEILEDLLVYCAANMANVDEIRVILPQKAIDAFNLQFYAKERVTLTGSVSVQDQVEPLPTICKWKYSGCIHIHSIEGNEETIRALK